MFQEHPILSRVESESGGPGRARSWVHWQSAPIRLKGDPVLQPGPGFLRTVREHPPYQTCCVGNRMFSNNPPETHALSRWRPATAAQAAS